MRLQIAWRSLRWRAGASAALLAVAVMGIAAGTFGPVYLQGANRSIVQFTLRSAPAGDTGLTLLARSGAVTVNDIRRVAALAPHAPNGDSLYGPVILTVDRPVTSLSLHNGQDYGADLISRTGICRHVVLVSGSCPTGMGQVAVSTRSARALGVHLGGRVAIAVPHRKAPVTLSVSGLFKAPDPEAGYWWGTNYFGFGQGSASLPSVDDFVTSQATILSIAAPGQAPLLGQLPLVAPRLSMGATPVEHALARLHRTAEVSYAVGTSTSLAHYFAVASSDEHTTTTIVSVVLAQLILLSLIVLYFVAARTAESREPDVRLAELRGYPLAGRAAVALLEPLSLLLIALPLGVFVAWLAGRLSAPRLFVHGVTPTIDGLAVGIALLTFAAGGVAIVLGARGLMRTARPSTPETGIRPLGLALDAIAVAFAVAAFVEVALSGVSSGSRTDPLAALAPGLLAFGLGVAGARLLPVLARLLIAPTRNSGRVGTTLASRRVARLTSLSRQVIVLSMSVGLATFAVNGWAVAGHNRAVRSEFAVGASRVLTVQSKPGVDFLPAVHKAERNDAMAVMIENASDGQTLAVDAGRLAAVASWPDGLTVKSASTIARSLRGTAAPAVFLQGDRLRVSADLLRRVTPNPQFQATVFDDDYDTISTLNLGSLRAGSHEYQASLAGACAGSCRLVNLGITWSPPPSSTAQSVHVALRVSALHVQSSTGKWERVAAGLVDARRWRGANGATLSSFTSGLAVDATLQVYGGAATFGPADVPASIPAVVIGSQSGVDGGVGLDGATINLKPVASVDALPGGRSDATMVDLALAERLQSGPMVDTTEQVWLTANAPQDVVQRLAAVGISVLSVRTATAEDAALSRGGISLAYVFFLLAAVVAALLAVGSTVFALVAAARRRTDELASLQAVGLGRASLRRSLVIEQGMVIGCGIILGVVAGIAATVAALASIPEFVASMARPPLDYRPPLGVLGIGLLAVVVSLAVAIVVTARLVVDRASVDNVGRDQS
jgi:hypothetical protein